MRIDAALSEGALRSMYNEINSHIPDRFLEMLKRMEQSDEGKRVVQPVQMSEMIKQQADCEIVAAHIPGQSDRRTPSNVESVKHVVNASAFAPVAATAGQGIIVQIFLHKLDQAPTARLLAKESDPRARRRGLATLAVELAVGEKVGITLDAPSVKIDEPMQSIVWPGTPQACQFVAALPAASADCDHHFCARIWLESVPIGALRFGVNAVVGMRPPVSQLTSRGSAARPIRMLFCHMLPRTDRR